MLGSFLLTLPLLLASPAMALPNDHLELATRSNNVTERGLLDAALGICIKIGADIDIRTSPLKTKLLAGTCICVDAEVNVGGGIGVDLEIEASGGAHFDGRIATDIASSILFPINPFKAYAFAIVNTCLQLDLLVDLSNSHHDFQPAQVKGCCKRTCNPGFIYDPIKKKCVPGCPPGQIKCGNTCYDPNTKTCSSGIVVPKFVPGRKRGLDRCPPGLQACAVGPLRDGAFECIDTRSDIESCGGCVNAITHVAPFGLDCTTLPNTDMVSCHHGSCRVDSCMRGFQVSANRTVCEPALNTIGSIGTERVLNIQL